jgi:hypothetical protein
MADALQTLIRSLPDCFTGQAAAEFTAQIAEQVKTQAQGLDTASSWLDFGEGTTVYSVGKIMEAANQLARYGASLTPDGRYCRASKERNQIIYLLGNLYGYLGARISVNATLAAAQDKLVEEVVANAKEAFDYGKWLVVAAVVIVVGIAAIKWKS